MELSGFAKKTLKERDRQAEELERDAGIKKETAVNLKPNILELGALNFIRDENWDKANNDNPYTTPRTDRQEDEKS